MRKTLFLLLLVTICVTASGSDKYNLKPNPFTGKADWVYYPDSAAPGSTGDKCEVGTIAYDTSYFYMCVATNTWRRAQVSEWTQGSLLLSDGSSFILLDDGSSKITIR